MRVFIIGKLGELVKKICELEYAIAETPSNQILLTELAAYQQVLTVWPVEDPIGIQHRMQMFKVELHNLRSKEEELRKTEGAWLPLVVAEYLMALDSVRILMTDINFLGMYIGPSPWLDLEESNDMEQVTD